MKISGVYQIRNSINGKLYIGSSKNLFDRLKGHKRSLEKSSHENYHLQAAYHLYGKENFFFEMIEPCPECFLKYREQYYMDLYEAYNSKFGYNKSRNTIAWMRGVKGKDHPGFGKARSDYVKSQVSKANIGNIPWNKGLTKETDPKVMLYSKKLIGHKVSESTKYAIRKFRLGKKQSKEFILKRTKNQLGKIWINNNVKENFINPSEIEHFINYKKGRLKRVKTKESENICI